MFFALLLIFLVQNAHFCSFDEIKLDAKCRKNATVIDMIGEKRLFLRQKLPEKETMEEWTRLCEQHTKCIEGITCQHIRGRFDATKEFCEALSMYSGIYGDCVRKIQTPKADCLEEFLRDFTARGIVKKCVDLKEKKTCLEDGIEMECGVQVKKVFNESIEIFENLYEC